MQCSCAANDTRGISVVRGDIECNWTLIDHLRDLLQCKCKNEKKAKMVTALGCAKGGFPWCPNTKDHKYFCRNGDTVFLEDLAAYQIQG